MTKPKNAKPKSEPKPKRGTKPRVTGTAAAELCRTKAEGLRDRAQKLLKSAERYEDRAARHEERGDKAARLARLIAFAKSENMSVRDAREAARKVAAGA